MLAAGFAQVFSIVMGVILALAGMALLLMALIAMTEKAVKQGALSAVWAVLLLAAGLWLIGVIG